MAGDENRRKTMRNTEKRIFRTICFLAALAMLAISGHPGIAYAWTVTDGLEEYSSDLETQTIKIA